MRLSSTFGSLTVILFYLIAQMVGAGQLIPLLFGIPYGYAAGSIGLAMTVYMLFGEMITTTWVQIIKAVLLLGCATFMTLAVKASLARQGGTDEATAAQSALRIPAPDGFIKDPASAVSLDMALMFGTAGLPHNLMRFLTVPDAKTARTSVLWATGWALTISHDLYASVLCKGRPDPVAELRLARLIVLALAVLGIVFEKQNVAFIVSWAFAVAASSNFPALLLSMLWKDCTTRGVALGSAIGALTAVVLTLLSPTT